MSYDTIVRIVVGGTILLIILFVSWFCTGCVVIPSIPGVTTISTTTSTTTSSAAGQSTGEIHLDHVGDDFQR